MPTLAYVRRSGSRRRDAHDHDRDEKRISGRRGPRPGRDGGPKGRTTNPARRLRMPGAAPRCRCLSERRVREEWRQGRVQVEVVHSKTVPRDDAKTTRLCSPAPVSMMGPAVVELIRSPSLLCSKSNSRPDELPLLPVSVRAVGMDRGSEGRQNSSIDAPPDLPMVVLRSGYKRPARQVNRGPAAGEPQYRRGDREGIKSRRTASRQSHLNQFGP
jgi:hypothetical protein